MAEAPAPATWLIDAHVHLHACFRLTDAFAAAATHFERAAAALRPGAGSLGCLILAENAGETLFRRLRDDGIRPGAGTWAVRATGEDASLLVERDGTPRFALLAGRQLVTTDRLEVLAVGLAEPPARIGSTRAAVDAVREAGGFAIVPWGFGKWWFRRGAIVGELLERATTGEFFLGDNGGRPRRFPAPPLLREAARRGIWNLPGSDPLPMPAQARRAGSYGFVLPVAPDARRPFTQIRDGLATLAAQPRLYGRRAGWTAFAAAQLRLRLRA